MIRRSYPDLAAVPPELADFYVEKDGRAVLAVEDDGEPAPDAGLKSALEKERAARKTAAAELKRFQADMGDLDPAKAREAIQRIAELEESDLLKGGNFEEAVNKRVSRLEADYKTESEKLRGENQTLGSRLQSVLIDTAIRDAARKAGIVPSAVEDAVLLGKQVWKLRDGQPVALDADGEPLSGGGPGKPLTVDEWLTSRADDRPHWFGASAGGGAPGSGDATATGGVVNVRRADAKNPTTYRDAKARAEKIGAELRIID